MNALTTSAVHERILPGYPRTLARLVVGKNIEPQTLLATDYLNHFNEIVMLFEILADMPDMLDEVRSWQPKSYPDHFRDSVFKDRDLAILAYENAPEEYRAPFDETIRQMDRFVLATIEVAADLVEQNKPEELKMEVTAAVAELGRLIDRAGAIIHGDTCTMHQSDIDDIIG